MAAYEGDTVRLRPTCFYCGGDTFSWGELREQGPVGWKDGTGSWLDRAFTPRETIRARLCNTCGNIQLFAEAAAEYRSGSGQQP